MGYRISRAYYRNTPDKKQAVADIIESTNPIRFLELSKYDQQQKSKAASTEKLAQQFNFDGGIKNIGEQIKTDWWAKNKSRLPDLDTRYAAQRRAYFQSVLSFFLLIQTFLSIKFIFLLP